MAEKRPQKKGAGRSAGTGNVTIDLGEEIDRKLRAAVGRGPVRPYRPGGYRPGLYRPGMFGGYRPWYASGVGGRWALGDKLGIPESLKTSQVLGGLLLGILGGRGLVRLTAEVIRTDSRIAHEAIAFGVGLIPLLVTRHSLAIGAGIPGFVFLGGAIADWMLDAVGVKRPMLTGGAGSSSSQTLARQRLSDVSARMYPQRQAPLPRVVAQPAFR